jgi:predicted nucleic acid-binding protein
VNYLLDTNVVSEVVKPRPDPRVVRWLTDADQECIWLSVITFAEIRFGAEQMPAGRRRDSVVSWLQNELPARFDGRIISVGLAVSDAWGAIMAQGRKLGARLEVLDGFFAATAKAHEMTLVTRNTRHFERLGIALLNPWTENR